MLFVFLPIFRFPMNLNSWPGYSVAYILGSGASYVACLGSIPYLSVLVGSCWILTAIGNDVTNELIQLNASNTINSDKNEVQIRYCDISKRLSDARQFSKIERVFGVFFFQLIKFSFRLVNDFSQLYEFKVFATFTWTLSSICCNMLVLQHNLVE